MRTAVQDLVARGPKEPTQGGIETRQIPMRKIAEIATVSTPRLLLVVFAIVMAAIGMLALQSCDAQHAPQPDRPNNQVANLSEVLQALAISPPINRNAFQESLKRHKEAVGILRTNGSFFLPQVMEEVYTIGRIERTNRSEAFAKTERLTLAFQALGEQTRVLLPSLKNEFAFGRSIGPCVAAFQNIGGTDCGLLLVSGLTNEDPVIRTAALSVLSSFSTNQDVAIAAVPPLLLRLKDDAELPRALSASVLGSFALEPVSVIPVLLEVAKRDPSMVVRVSAIKSIAHFGTNAVFVKADLDGLSTKDPDARVRRIALVAARSAGGEILPKDVR